MRDEDFEYFITKFGEATQHNAVPRQAIENWRGKLPDQLLDYWKNEGWNCYRNGLFSIVNPDNYEDIVDMWLEDTPFESMDSYHVIARSGFGKLYLCGQETGTNISISCVFNTIFYGKEEFYKKNKKELDFDIATLCSSQTIKSLDIKESEKSDIFSRAIEKYGLLNENEIFGFEPAIILGGEAKLKNIRKLDMHIHLNILRQFSVPEIVEF